MGKAATACKIQSRRNAAAVGNGKNNPLETALLGSEAQQQAVSTAPVSQLLAGLKELYRFLCTFIKSLYCDSVSASFQMEALPWLGK